MGQHKITSSEHSILERLVFPEPFATIMEETGLQPGELRDDLINLLNFGFVEAYEFKDKRITTTGFYDADNLQKFSFRATSKGLSAI
jgi:hypothetical protein